MNDGPGEAHQIARFVSVGVPGNKRTSRKAHHQNVLQRLGSFLAKFPNFTGLAWRLANEGHDPLFILERVTAHREKAGIFWPFVKTRFFPREIRTTEKSN